MATATSTRQLVYQRPWMYEKQRQAVFNPLRYAVIEASTKSGKTIACMIWLAEQAMAGKKGRNYWWVAPIYPQAKIAYRRLKAGLPPQVYSHNDTELTITLANGAVIWFKGADKPDSLYGEDVYAAVVDEASRCKEDAWYAVRSTLTQTRGAVRIIGNVKGRKNWAYKLARRAEAGEKDMTFTRITAMDAVEGGVLDAEEIEDAKRQLPEAVFNELYMAEASEDEGNPFGITSIRACIAPLSPLPPAVWGWDLAKSHDYTVGIGLDVNGRTCRLERWNKHQLPPGIPPGTDYWDATEQRIKALTGSLPAYVDSTGVGDPVFEKIAKGRPNILPYHFTGPSKQQLMEGLAVAVQQREVTFPAGVIVLEMESFEYVYTRTGVKYSAPEGMYDDCVCGLALAVLRRGRKMPQEFAVAVGGQLPVVAGYTPR